MFTSRNLDRSLDPCRHVRLLQLGVALFVLLVAGIFPIRVLAASDALYFTVQAVYRVQPGGSVVNVQVNAEIENQDSTTTRTDEGVSYFYDEVAVSVPALARNVRATDENGNALSTRRERDVEAWDVVWVQLGRRLFFGDTYRLLYTYDLAELNSDIYRIAPNVARFPGFLPGDEGSVRAEVPVDYELELDGPGCTLNTRDQLQVVDCANLKDLDSYAFYLVAVRPTELVEVLSEPIPLAQATIQLKTNHYAGERDWATTIISTLTKALPVLEEIMGFAYQGPKTIELTQATTRETLGFSGIYEDKASVLIQPSAPVEVIVHEGAHLWSEPFADRWIYEGWAEWASREAMRRLNIRPQFSETDFADLPEMDLPLQVWDWEGSINSTRREAREAFGYAKSYAFMKLLVQRAGLETLQEVTRGYVDPPAASFLATGRYLANSRNYLDAIEDEGVEAADLWRDWVLKEQDAALLPARAAARQRQSAIRPRWEALGWEAPLSVTRRMQQWSFDLAMPALDDAEAVLDAWTEMAPRLGVLGWEVNAGVRVLFENGTDLNAALALVAQLNGWSASFAELNDRWLATDAILPLTLQKPETSSANALTEVTVVINRQEWGRIDKLMATAATEVEQRETAATAWVAAAAAIDGWLIESSTLVDTPGATLTSANLLAPAAAAFAEGRWTDASTAIRAAQDIAQDWRQDAERYAALARQASDATEWAHTSGLPIPSFPVLETAQRAFALADAAAFTAALREAEGTLALLVDSRDALAGAHTLSTQSDLWVRLGRGAGAVQTELRATDAAWMRGDLAGTLAGAEDVQRVYARAQRRGQVGFILLLLAASAAFVIVRRRVGNKKAQP